MNKKFLLFFLFFSLTLFFFLVSAENSYADISNFKDTISTSRPSAVGTLNLGATAGLSQITINAGGARFIASDSARLIGGTMEMATVASMSAVSGGTAALYFTDKTTQNHAIGSTVMASIPAQHVISFQANNAPAGGNIQVIFPIGDTANPTYASPNGFSFNGLASANLSASFSPAGPTCSWVITPASGLVQCNVGTGITGATSVTINIGLTQTNPVLVNPTKTAAAGSQDAWTVRAKINDASSREIDSIKGQIATIDAVDVYATVDAFINFTIGGIANAAAVNIGNSTPTGCGTTQPTNSGFASTATEVNLGTLGSGQVNLSAQLLTVTTNGQFGYSLTATSSGHLIDSAIGYWLADAQGSPIIANDNPAPVVITTGTPAFGIHACGQDVTVGTWGPNVCTAGIDCKYANPSAAYYYTLASDSAGPIGPGSADSAGDGLTSVEYAATISAVVPAGLYHTAITYIATATF